MKISYHLATQTVTVDVTPEEVGALTPAVAEGLVRGLLDLLKEAGATLVPGPVRPTGEAEEPVARGDV